MTGDRERPLAVEELEEVLQQAIAFEQGSEPATTTVGDAYRIAAELGISVGAVDRAFSERLNRTPNLRGCTSASVTVADEPAPFVRRLDEALRRRDLEPCRNGKAGCWEQRRGWWPDIAANVTISTLGTSVEGYDRFFRVTLFYPLVWIRLVYLAMALVGLVAAVLIAATGVIGTVVWVLATAVATGFTYHQRVQAIQSRLAEALHESNPSSNQD